MDTFRCQQLMGSFSASMLSLAVIKVDDCHSHSYMFLNYRDAMSKKDRYYERRRCLPLQISQISGELTIMECHGNGE